MPIPSRIPTRPRRWLAGAAALALVASAAACGDGSDETATTSAEPTATTAPAAGAATPEQDETPDGTASPAGKDVEDAALAVVDAYIDAIAAGDLGTAWDLLDQRSRAALGDFAAFEQLRSGLSEGIGAWSAAEDRASHVVRLDDDAAVVLLEGIVPLEGPPARATQSVLVRGLGDAIDRARVSPFEEALAEGSSVDLDTPEAT